MDLDAQRSKFTSGRKVSIQIVNNSQKVFLFSPISNTMENALLDIGDIGDITHVNLL
jgi:hypothetical protein